jgi:hypothetical protein
LYKKADVLLKKQWKSLRIAWNVQIHKTIFFCHSRKNLEKFPLFSTPTGKSAFIDPTKDK